MTRLPILLVLSLAMAAPAYAASSMCNSPRQGAPLSYNIDLNVRRVGNDLLFTTRNGQEQVRMTADHRLLVGGEEVALTQPQRLIVGQFIATHDQLVADAKAIGMAGARLGTRAAFGAVRAIFTPGASMAAFEADIEAQARELEEQADSLCLHVATLHEHHQDLSAQVPAFAAAVPLKD